MALLELLDPEIEWRAIEDPAVKHGAFMRNTQGVPMSATPVPTGRTDTRRDTPRRVVGGGLSRLATETKAAFKTTEFYAYLVTFALILIAGAQIKEKNNVDAFRADKVWLYVTILTVGYMIARGLAKAGSNEPYWRDSGDNHERDNDR